MKLIPRPKTSINSILSKTLPKTVVLTGTKEVKSHLHGSLYSFSSAQHKYNTTELSKFTPEQLNNIERAMQSGCKMIKFKDLTIKFN